MALGRCPLSIFCSRGTPPREVPTLSLSTLNTFLYTLNLKPLLSSPYPDPTQGSRPHCRGGFCSKLSTSFYVSTTPQFIYHTLPWSCSNLHFPYSHLSCSNCRWFLKCFSLSGRSGRKEGQFGCSSRQYTSRLVNYYNMYLLLTTTHIPRSNPHFTCSNLPCSNLPCSNLPCIIFMLKITPPSLFWRLLQSSFWRLLPSQMEWQFWPEGRTLWMFFAAVHVATSKLLQDVFAT